MLGIVSSSELFTFFFLDFVDTDFGDFGDFMDLLLDLDDFTEPVIKDRSLGAASIASPLDIFLFFFFFLGEDLLVDVWPIETTSTDSSFSNEIDFFFFFFPPLYFLEADDKTVSTPLLDLSSLKTDSISGELLSLILDIFFFFFFVDFDLDLDCDEIIVSVPSSATSFMLPSFLSDCSLELEGASTKSFAEVGTSDVDSVRGTSILLCSSTFVGSSTLGSSSTPECSASMVSLSQEYGQKRCSAQ